MAEQALTELPHCLRRPSPAELKPASIATAGDDTIAGEPPARHEGAPSLCVRDASHPSFGYNHGGLSRAVDA